jgi:energy-coupling factor transporter transmembrane protein EcfT
MKKTFIGTRIIIYYVILLILMILCIMNFAINPVFFSIMIGLIVVLWTINRSTIIKVEDEIKIIDIYLFIPVVRKKIDKKELQTIEVKKVDTDEGFGISNNIFLDIIIIYLFGFYWSQPLSSINYKLKGKPKLENIKLNLTAKSVKKVLD